MTLSKPQGQKVIARVSHYHAEHSVICESIGMYTWIYGDPSASPVPCSRRSTTYPSGRNRGTSPPADTLVCTLEYSTSASQAVLMTLVNLSSMQRWHTDKEKSVLQFSPLPELTLINASKADPLHTRTGMSLCASSYIVLIRIGSGLTIIIAFIWPWKEFISTSVPSHHV